MVCLVYCLIICASMHRWKGGSVCFCFALRNLVFMRGQGSFLCWSCFHCYGDGIGEVTLSPWFQTGFDITFTMVLVWVRLEKLVSDQRRRDELAAAMETDVTFWIKKRVNTHKACVEREWETRPHRNCEKLWYYANFLFVPHSILLLYWKCTLWHVWITKHLYQAQI